ncbi:TatD family hydrolase [candidate division KSB1 bacterium]|nr:TatD family hydrolase [candidate division KSB1 bacterium]
MNVSLIETHAHLDFNQYDGHRDSVIQRAFESGIEKIINIGINLETSLASIALAEEYENIYAAVGVHPHDVDAASEIDLEEIKRLYEHPKVIAIGEVGLDFYRNYSRHENQRKLFRMFLDWSFELDLPLIIHSRAADDELMSILKSKAKTGWKGVVHCFSGDEKTADTLLDFGFFISFTGSITFKNFRSAHVVKHIPLERLLVETDCPFMAPEPHRGKRNEPAFVHYIAQKIAELKNVTIADVAKKTSKNAKKLFNLV